MSLKVLNVFEGFREQNAAVKLMLCSDFIECVVASFASPVIQKCIYSSECVTSKMIALSTALSCLATVFWNKLFNEKRRQKLFEKTYLFGLIGYGLSIIVCTFVTVLFNNILFYWWAELGVSLTLGRIWSQGNAELFGNLFSTEERKTYDRLHSNVFSVACLIGSGVGVFVVCNFAVAFIVWALTYIFDMASMSYLFIYENRHSLLKPRVDKIVDL